MATAAESSGVSEPTFWRWMWAGEPHPDPETGAIIYPLKQFREFREPLTRARGPVSKPPSRCTWSCSPTMGPEGIVKLLADALNLYPISCAQVQTRSDASGVSRELPGNFSLASCRTAHPAPPPPLPCSPRQWTSSRHGRSPAERLSGPCSPVSPPASPGPWRPRAACRS